MKIKFKEIQLTYQQRVVIVALLLLFYLAISNVNSSLQTVFHSAWEMKNAVDTYMWMYMPVARFLIENPVWREALLISNALFIDLVSLYMLFYWCVNPMMSSMILTSLFFYAIRGLAVGLVTFPLPHPYLFIEPPFPSLLVSYKVFNDMYFSGHTGLMTIFMDGTRLAKWKKFHIVCILSLLMTVFMLAVTGGHFTNDLIIGFVVAKTLTHFCDLHRNQLVLGVLTGYCVSLAFIRKTILRIEEKDESLTQSTSRQELLIK